MAKEYIYLKGTFNWARLVKPNKWDKWSIQLHPDAESLEMIRDLQAEGIKHTLKKDDDGYFINIGRPTTKTYVKTGQTVSFTPPMVVDKDGVPLDGSTIGNGSSGSLKVEVYSHGTPGGGKAKNIRLEAVKVDNHVMFNPDTDFNEFEKAEVEGLKDQKEALF